LTQPKIYFTNSGRASIFLALEMLGIGPGDKVLVPTYHCPTMISPIVALGAQPVFYPLGGDGAPRLDWIRRENTQGVRAILVAHFFGLPQPLTEVRQWCDQHGIRLVEDCAHAFFGVSGDRALGRWGDLAIASLTKFLPVPEGGVLVDNMAPVSIPLLQRPSSINEIKAGLDILHDGVNHGRLKGLGALLRGSFGFLRMFKIKKRLQDRLEDPALAEGFTVDTAQSHRALTYASRWIALHAPRERIVARRREHYVFFAQALSGLAGVRPLRSALPENCAPYVFPLWVDHPDPGYAELRRLGFPVSRWDRLWPTAFAIEDDSGIKWSHHILQLACHQDLTPAELQQMIDTVKKIYVTNAVESVSRRPKATELAELLKPVRIESLYASAPPNKST
jgi:hypothetical protein